MGLVEVAIVTWRPSPGRGAETVRSRLKALTSVDDAVFDPGELIVGVRNEAFLQVVGDDRHDDPTISNGVTIRAEVIPAALSASYFAFAKPLHGQ